MTIDPIRQPWDDERWVYLEILKIAASPNFDPDYGSVVVRANNWFEHFKDQTSNA